MKRFTGLFIIFLSFCSISLNAQEKKAARDSLSFKEQDEAVKNYDSILEESKIIMNRHPQDSEIGSFEILNDNKNFLMRFGGFAKLTTYYDLGLENNLFFSIFDISTVEDRPKGRVNFHVYESRVNTEVVGESSLGFYRVFIEGDFLGNGGGSFRLRHAFGQFQGFTFGQTWSYFMDVQATPFSIDFNGPPGVTFARKPLIGYNNKNLIKNSKIGVSIENPNSDIFATQFDSRPQIYPDFVINYTYNKDDNHIKIAAIQRSFIYDDTVKKTEEVTDGYGIMLSGSFKPSKKIKLSSQLTYGKGISEYLSLNQDLVATENGAFESPRIYALFASVTYTINYRSNVSAFYSYVDLVDNFSLPDNQFSRGQQININYILDVTPTMKTGVEAIGGISENIAGSRGSAARLYVFFLMAF